MTYPKTPGFQAHSDTSRAAASRLSTADSMERDIYELLDAYPEGWTGDQLAEYLGNCGHEGVQTGTIAARLRGLELKGKAVKLQETRLTRSKRKAHVWVTPRLVKGRPTACAAPPPSGATLQAMVTRMELKIEALKNIVSAQAEDEGLWFQAATLPEAYLQQELRRLHAAIEVKND